MDTLVTWMDGEIALSVQQKEKRETSLNGLLLSRNLTGNIMTTENSTSGEKKYKCKSVRRDKKSLLQLGSF